MEREEAMSLDLNIEQHLKALEFFKDWSNYLLVTTVAALGWVASADRPAISPRALRWVIGCLGFSVVFAVFTLALVPLVAEGITKQTQSFYDVVAHFDLIWFLGPEIPFKLKWVCWPQHILFLAGIITYTVANIRKR